MEIRAAHSSYAADGTSLHWAEVGTGRPVVMLHGLSDSHRTWRHVAEILSTRRRVLMLDLPGHGLSGRPDATYALDWHAEVVGQWIEHLGLEDIDLVGHSFGGGVAQFLLLSHAERVRKLALVAPGGLGREVGLGLRLLTLPGAEIVVQPFLGVGTRIALRSLGPGAFTPADLRWLAWANSAPGTARALTRTVRGVIDLGGQHRNFLDHAHELERLPPVAVFWGDRDPILPIAQAHRAVAAIDGAELTTFTGCGHFPHLEQPDLFLDALSRFLDDDGARRARVVVGAQPPARPTWVQRGIDLALAGLQLLLRRSRSRHAARPPGQLPKKSEPQPLPAAAIS